MVEELRYELAGAGVKVRYRTDPDTVHILELELGNRRWEFQGAGIDARHSKIGGLYTVALDTTRDAPWTGFSVLLPHVGELGLGTDRARIWALGIRTTGPPNPDPDDPDPPQLFTKGVLQSYELFELAGTVSRAGAPEPPETAVSEQWSAVRTIDDQDRGNRDTLEVEGLLVFPRTGYTVGLQEAVHHHPRRSGELPLELTVNPPDGATDQTPTTVVARYTTKTTTRYRTVTIVPNGPRFPVEVTVSCRPLRATQDGRQLRVEAILWVPKGDYQVGLRRAVPQSRDPRDLWLQLTVREPATPPGFKASQRVEVGYEESSDVTYDRVTILPNRVAAPATAPGGDGPPSG
jgi:hypothetical protein